MTDTPTPQMTPEQRAEFVAWLRRVRMRPTVADQLEADGVTIAALTAERDAALADADMWENRAIHRNREANELGEALEATQAEIARLTAALATAREDGMREAMQCCQAVANEAKSYNIPQMTMGANTCRDAILDAITKGAAT